MEAIMQAVEFESHVENGVITIPHKYRDSVADTVRVILLNNESPKMDKKSQKIYSLGIDMAGYKFNREEANER
jgi:5-methylcytosine-specific restriction endonuclease McrBC regulatory subunit McrC